MKFLALTAALGLLAAPALAESHASGDTAAGEAAFGKQCVTCHVVVNEAGETLAGRKARTGPNLYGVAGRAVAGIGDFRYGKSIAEVGAAGHVWTEENFVTYVQDPTSWLRETLDDKSARSKMSFKVRREKDAHNLYAFLLSIGPEVETEMDTEMTEQPASN